MVNFYNARSKFHFDLLFTVQTLSDIANDSFGQNENFDSGYVDEEAVHESIAEFDPHRPIFSNENEMCHDLFSPHNLDLM